jgi:hypothetical protein
MRLMGGGGLAELMAGLTGGLEGMATGGLSGMEQGDGNTAPDTTLSMQEAQDKLE